VIRPSVARPVWAKTEAMSTLLLLIAVCSLSESSASVPSFCMEMPSWDRVV